MAKDDSNEEQNKENESDDTFGLPEIEYTPINREEEQTSTTESTSEQEYVSESTSSYQYQPPSSEESYSYTPEEEQSSTWPKVLGILLVILIAGGAAYYFAYYKPQQLAKQKELAEQASKREAEKKEQERIAAEARMREEAERRKADSLASVPKVGAVEQLTAPTGRYYVVVTSAVDGDLLMDHAKRLSKEGVSTKIIPPFGKYKFYRLTIAEGDSFASAQEIADSKKADYGQTWVLKY